MHLSVTRPVPNTPSRMYLSDADVNKHEHGLICAPTTLRVCLRACLPGEALVAEEVALIALHHLLERKLVKAALALDQLAGRPRPFQLLGQQRLVLCISVQLGLQCAHRQHLLPQQRALRNAECGKR